MEKRVSLADIARRTGFGVSTVSMALRQDASIPLTTRQEIEAAARELGYHPNPLLAALASKHFRLNSIHVTPLALVRFAYQSQQDQRVMQRIIEAVETHARRFGYRLEAFKVSDFKDGKEATRILFSRGFQGIILPTNFLMRRLPGMDWNRFSIVGCGENCAESSDSTQPLISHVAVDHFRLVRRAWEETWNRGYRRIGFVLFELKACLMEDQVRRGAALACIEQVPKRLRVPTFSLKLFRANDSVGLATWLRRHHPDAVIGFNGLVAWRLRQAGWRIPEDIGFVSLHVDNDGPTAISVRDSGMKEMRVKSMQVSVELLDQQIRHHQYGLPREPRAMMIDSEWIDGDTLPPKAAACVPARACSSPRAARVSRRHPPAAPERAKGRRAGGGTI